MNFFFHGREYQFKFSRSDFHWNNLLQSFDYLAGSSTGNKKKPSTPKALLALWVLDCHSLFSVLLGIVLTNHSISIHHVTSPIDCGFLCTSNEMCMSYNYRPSGFGDECHLNNASRTTADPIYFVIDSSFTYYFDRQEVNLTSTLLYKIIV